MNRRDFLKLGGVVSTVFLLQASPIGRALGFPTQAKAEGLLYRGTRTGRIYVSSDGITWEQLVNFGPKCAVTRVAQDDSGQVTAMLRFARRTFKLGLAPDGKNWFTK